MESNYKTTRKQRGDSTKRNKVISTHADFGFTQDDIPHLLELITELQQPIRRKQIKKIDLPNADVLVLEQFKKRREST